MHMHMLMYITCIKKANFKLNIQNTNRIIENLEKKPYHWIDLV